TLWALKNASTNGLSLDALPDLPRAGLTSAPANPATPEALYRVFGFHLCGPRAVRLDILERLADLIRPLLAWRAKPDNPMQPPKGSTGDGGFVVTPEKMSILGCSPDELSHVLKALGFRLDRKTVTPSPVAASAAALQEAVAAGEESAAPASEAPATATPPASEAEPDVAPSPEDAPVAEAAAAAPAEAASALLETPAEPAKADAAEAAAPAVIEIWRPKRRHEDRPARDHAAANRDPARNERGDRNVRGDRRRHQGRRNGAPQTSDRPAAASVPVAPIADGSVAPQGATPGAADTAGAGGRPQHRDRGRDRGPRDNDRGPRDGDRNRPRPQGGREGGSGPGQHRRDDNRRRPDDRQAPMMRSASPPSKKGGVDPDSPFAQLGALREALAKQAREKNPT
ncbi:MAG: helicase, partial [Hyphomicrobium sp.]|nr:helicase [Hyphomicrobium sp.]